MNRLMIGALLFTLSFPGLGGVATAEEHIEVFGIESRKLHGTVIVSGSAVNRTSGELKNLQVRVTLKDRDGRPIDRFVGPLDTDVLAPGATSSFQVDARYDPDTGEMKIDFLAEDGRAIPAKPKK